LINQLNVKLVGVSEMYDSVLQMWLCKVYDIDDCFHVVVFITLGERAPCYIVI